MRKLRIGAVITRRELMTTRSQQIPLPDPASLVHLQFRRYAGCPFCNLHLRSFAHRYQQLVAAGIREVVVFQSPAADLLAQQGDVPFAVIPDPQRMLYAEFAVASSPRAVLDPRAWLAERGLSSRNVPCCPRTGNKPSGCLRTSCSPPTASSWRASTACTPTTSGR